MSERKFNETDNNKKTKYLHTFFPERQLPQVSRNSNQPVKTGSLQQNKKSYNEVKEKMVLAKPHPSWRPKLGPRNAIEEKLEEVRVKDQVLEEAREENSIKEKGWYTDPTESATSIKQDNEPWYKADIWGDDFPEEAIEECIMLASSTVLEDKESVRKKDAEGCMDWLWRDDDEEMMKTIVTQLDLTSKTLPQNRPNIPISDDSRNRPSNKHSATRLGGQEFKFQTQQSLKPLIQKIDHLPKRKSDVICEDSMIKLTQSQRKLEKPTRSMPLSSSQAHTTEWLRNQLEKINAEYNALKENMLTKEGESKLLREKLNCSQKELEKIKADKANEIEILKKSMEAQIKDLEKKLESTRTQMLFKTKEAESNFGRFSQRIDNSVFQRQNFSNTTVTADKSVSKIDLNASFKKFISGEGRPGELLSQSQSVSVFKTSCNVSKAVSPLLATPVSSAKSSARISTSAEVQSNIEVENQLDIDMFGDDSDIIKDFPDTDFSSAKTQIVEETIVDNSSKIALKYKNLALKSSTDENVTTMIEDMKKISVSFNRKESKMDFKGHFLSKLIVPEILTDVPLEMNYVVLPDEPYNSRKLLFKDVHEQPAENYRKTRPNLKEIWKIPLEAFIPSIERSTNLLHEFKERPLEPDPGYTVLSAGRYFTSFSGCITYVHQLISCEYWDRNVFDNIILKIVEHIRKMAAEIYAAVGDPRLLSATFTVDDREDKVTNECLDYSEMLKNFSVLSSERWKEEIYIDLRRGLGVLTAICTLDRRLCLYLLDPRLLKLSRTSPSRTNVKSRSESYDSHTKATVSDKFEENSDQKPTSSKANIDSLQKNDIPSLDKFLENHLKKSEDSSTTLISSSELKKFESELYPPKPNETVDNYKCRILLEHTGGLSQDHLAILNRKVEEYIKLGQLKYDMKFNNENQGKQINLMKTEKISSTVLETKNKEICLKENNKEMNEDNEESSKNFITPEWSRFTSLWNDEKQNESKRITDKITWEKIVKNDFKGIDSSSNDLIERKNSQEKIQQSMSSTLIKMPIPQWMVKIKQTPILQERKLIEPEDMFVREDDCLSHCEKEFVETIALNAEKLKTVIKGCSKPIDDEELATSSMNSMAVACKRKFERDKGVNSVSSVTGRNSPPTKKRETTTDLLKAGTSSVSTSQNESLDSFNKELNFKAFVSKGWKKSSYKKSDIAPLKNVTGSELSAKAQDELNKEVEMEIEKMFTETNEESTNQTDVTEAHIADTTVDLTQKLYDEEMTELDSSQLKYDPDCNASSDSEIESDVRLITLEECLSTFNKKLNSAGLLELLFEIVKAAGLLRYTWKFNAMMATFAHLLEVISSHFSKELPPSSISKIAAILRELLYTRPSPIVVYYINRCLTKAVRIKGFIKTLCHNSDSKTFVKNEDEIYYVKGSCMLQILCLLMDLTIDDSCWDSPLQLIRWTKFVFVKEKVTAKTWYAVKNGVRIKRCFCLQALSNLVVRILHRTVVFYRTKLYFKINEENFDINLHNKLEEILHSGLDLVAEMVYMDMPSFVKNIRTSHPMYVKFLQHLEAIHLNNKDFPNFQLPMSSFCKLQMLLSWKRVGEKIIEEIDKIKSKSRRSTKKSNLDDHPDFSNLKLNSDTNRWPLNRIMTDISESALPHTADTLTDW